MAHASPGNTCGVILATVAIGTGVAGGRPEPRRATGGCIVLESPRRDARDCDPPWLDTPAHTLRLIGGAQRADHCSAFDLWRLPGRKRLIVCGEELHLTAERSHPPLRLMLGAGIRDGGAFAYVVPAVADMRVVLSEIGRVQKAFAMNVLPAAHPDRARPSRTALLHTRALQALDGAAAGASQRELAEVLFGTEAVAERWLPDGELRAQLRHLLRRGRGFMNGGYRALLMAS
jgi:hypothetical protein